MRICFLVVHEPVSAMAIRCDTSGAITSDVNKCPTGCSHRPGLDPGYVAQAEQRDGRRHRHRRRLDGLDELRKTA